MNVGTCQVEPVIRSFLCNIATIECCALKHIVRDAGRYEELGISTDIRQA